MSVASNSVEQALGSVQVAEILGVHPRTVERRQASKTRLNRLQVQRQEKLRRVWKELQEMFDPDQALQWLRTPLPAAEFRRPLDVMADDGGLDRILELIGRMSWGIPV